MDLFIKYLNCSAQIGGVWFLFVAIQLLYYLLQRQLQRHNLMPELICHLQMWISIVVNDTADEPIVEKYNTFYSFKHI